MLLNFKHLNFDKNFVGLDSKENYTKNLHSADKDWYYRDNPIEYNVNSHNYRCAEFDDIDWDNSVLILGCSHAFGTGLHTEDTIAKQLEKLLPYQVVNLGVPASSMYFSFLNQVILKKNNINPKGVVNIWTSIERYSLFKENNTDPFPIGPWVFHPQVKQNIDNSIIDFYLQWTKEQGNMERYGKMLSDIANIFWNDIPHIECTFFSNTAESLGIELIEQVDYARDLHHPGKNTIKNLANYLNVI